jgi:TP901 family phage tail tape measure protein
MAFESIGLGGVLKFDGNQAVLAMGKAQAGFAKLLGKANLVGPTMGKVAATTSRALGTVAQKANAVVAPIGRAANATQRAFSQVSNVAKRVGSSLAVAGKHASTARAAFVRLNQNIMKLPAAMGRAAAAVARGAARIAKSSAKKIGAGFSQMAGAARGGAMAMLPFTAGVGFAAKKAADFEQQMSVVASIGGKAFEDKLGDLELKAKQLGASTQFTATQSGQAMEFMARAGAKPGEIMGGIAGVMNAAAADSIELATAADIVAQTVKGMGLEWGEASRVADVLANTSSKSNTNITALGETFKMAAGGARNLGIPLEETAAVAGKLADAGLRGTLGGTALNNMFNKLAKATPKGAEQMEKWGIALSDSNNKLLPISRIVEQFKNKFDKIKDPIKRAGMATELFGLRGQKAFFALANAGKKGLDDLVSSNNEAEGRAKEMARIRLDNLKGQLTIFASAMEGFSIEIMQPLLKPLTGFVTAAAKGLGQVVQAMQKIAFASKRVMSGVGSDADIAKGVIEEFGPVIGNIALGFTDAIAKVKSGFAAIQAFIKRTGDRLKATFGGDAIRTFAKWGALLALGAAALAPILLGFAGIAFVISSVVVPAISGLASIISGAFWPVLIIAGAVLLAWQMLKQENESFLETVIRVWGSVKTWILGVYNDAILPLIAGIRDVLGPVIQELAVIWNETVQFIKFAIADVTAAFSDGTDQTATDWREVGRTIGAVIGAVMVAVLKVVNFLIPLIATLLPPLIKFVIMPFQMIWRMIKNVVGAFEDMFSGNILRGFLKLGTAILDFVLAPIRQIMAAAIKLAETLKIPIPAGVKTFAEEGVSGLVFPEEKKKTPGVKVVESGLKGVQDAGDISAAKQITALERNAKVQQAKPPKIDFKADLTDKRQLNVNNCLNVDGREVAYASGRHKQELSERGGFKTTPFQRKMLLEQGALPVGAGG